MRIFAIVVKRSNDKGAWKWWREKWVFNVDVLPTWELNRNQIEQFFLLNRSLQLVTTETMCITVFEDKQASEGQQGPLGWTFNFINRYKQGDVPLQGETFYRHKLILRLDRESGRPRHKWLTGCMSTGDISETGSGAKYYNKAARVNEWLAGNGNQVGNIINQTLVLGEKQLGGLFPAEYEKVTRITCIGYTEAHAITRWKRRNTSYAVELGMEVMLTLQLMAQQYEENAGRIAETQGIHYADTYYKTVALLNGTSALADKLREYHDKPNPEGGGDQDPPIRRFGFNLDNIATAWENAWDTARNQVPELQKVYKTYNDANGFEFINASDLEPYNDMLKEFIQKLSFSVWYDYYNPKSYPDQTPPDTYDDLLDVIELSI